METPNAGDNAHHPTEPPPARQLHCHDSLDVESARLEGRHAHGAQVAGWAVVLHLAFQSLGVVYGDIGTSPLYTYAGTFPNGIKHKDDIVGVLSIVYYAFTLLPIIKYVFIVLGANDNGNGGTFALYSLLCRHVKISSLPSVEAEDQEVSTYKLETPKGQRYWSLKVKAILENSGFAKFTLLTITMLATALVIGDGILTPCISVLSAVGGIKLATPAMTEDRVVWISVAIIVLLFSVQRFGTDKVGYCFAPIMCIWFLLNSVIGVYNFFKYNPTVIKAVNPWRIVEYFSRNGRDAWISLGGVVLCITGTEALFADLAHFTVRSIQISTCSLVYPALMMAYSGQASYLSSHPEDVSQAFYKAIPGPLYWPVFVVAVLAAIIASQAMISGTFPIIHQSLSLGCFPRVTIVHTSAKYEGQVYIPELNFLIMVACVCVILGFRTTDMIGNAYGIAIVFAEFITSSFMVLVMILVWKKHIFFIGTYVVVVMSVELTYLTSVLYKFPHGGYLPLAFASSFMIIMIVWNYVFRKKYYYEMDHKVSPDQLRDLVSRTSVQKIPGLAIFYSELVHGIPPIFEHYANNIPALHSVLVFVSFKSLPISKVPFEERFLFRRAPAQEVAVYRCVVRYGYTDLRAGQEPLEAVLVDWLKNFVGEESLVRMVRDQGEIAEVEAGAMVEAGAEEEIGAEVEVGAEEEIRSVAEERPQSPVISEVELLEKAARAGVVHLVGETEVIAGEGLNLVKKLMINNGYNFLKRNLRQSDKALGVPRRRLLKVGMTYEL